MELRMYFDILARRWRSALVVALVVICVAALGGQFVSPTYQAETRLRVVTPLGGSLGETNYQTTFAIRLMNTYAQIATSGQVNNELKNKLGLASLPNIAVKIIPDSEIIQIVVEGNDPAIAAQTANALADLLFSYQSKAANDANTNELSVLTNRKEELKTELDQAKQDHSRLVQTYSQTTAEIAILDRNIKIKEASYQNLINQYNQVLVSEAVAPSLTFRRTKDALALEMDRLQNEMDILNKQYKELMVNSNEYLQQITLIRQSMQNTQSAYSDLAYRYDTALTANYRQENAQSIITVSPAVKPSSPSGPGRLFIVGLGVICGLIAGIVTAFVIDNLDTRIFSLEQIRSVTVAPIIGSISKFHGPQSRDVPDDKDPVIQRDYWMLRTKLQALIQEGSVKTIMLTSPNRSEGKSTIVYDLASELAQNNFKVLVVDADLRIPRQHKLFNVTGIHGLRDFLSGEDNNIKGMILKDVKPGIDLLPSLTECENPTDLLQPLQLKALFESLKAYDIVLFDTPAFLAIPDALDLAKIVDGVIVVARWGHTTSDDIRSVFSHLESIGSKLMGLIANQVPARKTSYYHRPERLHHFIDKAKKNTVHFF